MTNLDRLQVYLLSKMSAAELVRDALGRLGVGEQQMKRIADDVAAEAKLDESIRQADELDRLIGGGASESLAVVGVDDSVFAGSLRREYKLPLWPSVEFVVHRHPTGYAWNVQFEQRELPQFTRIQSVVPWKWTRSSVVSVASSCETWDEWSDYFEATLTFPNDSSNARYRARFDLGLLQTIGIEPQT